MDGVDLDIRPGEVLGLVGESGSGKSVTALSVLRLIPDPPGRIVAGEILFKGRDLLKLSWDEIRKIRGNDISMIFQEPMTSLNPVFTIGMQVTEVILSARGRLEEGGDDRRVDMLEPSRHPGRGRAHEAVPASVLRRHAPARDDRDGARAEPGAAHRRRADDGARRDDPGADPRSDAGAEGRAGRARRFC